MATKKKEVVINNTDQYQAYLTRKLKHYNEWLMDNDRDFTKPYPGFPEDKAGKIPTRKQTNVVPVSKPVVKKPTKGKKTMSINTVGIKIASRGFTLMCCLAKVPSRSATVIS